MADRSKTPDLFTPLFECVVEKYGIIGAGVFGEVSGARGRPVR